MWMDPRAAVTDAQVTWRDMHRAGVALEERITVSIFNRVM